MEKQYKVIILVVPFWGHINPISGLASGLVSQKQAHVIFFGNQEHKQIIEATGSQFKCYSYFPTVDIQKTSNDPQYQSTFPPIFTQYLIHVTSVILPELIDTVNKEKPDLIIYDTISIHAKYLIEYLQKNESNHKPASLIFSPTFTQYGGVYPNVSERQLNYEKQSLYFYYYLFKAYVRQIPLYLKFGFRLKHPIKFLSNVNDTKLNLVAMFPELQARSSLCSKNVKFVGCCVNEVVRSVQSLNLEKPLLNLFDLFQEKNPVRLDVDDYFLSEKSFSLHEKKLLLVYVSLGTFFNQSFHIYEKILNAFRILDEYNLEDKSQFPKLLSKKIHVVVSCGSEVFNVFQDKLKLNQYSLPENVLLLKSAPQISILKRADLFISHCGMNSSSEAIYYGVPIVGIPILADQPRVAYRILDELGFGIHLRLQDLTAHLIRDAIYNVLTDKAYKERVIRYSRISRKYDGVKNSANYAIELIESNKTKI